MTVAEAEERLSGLELVEWQAYFKLEKERLKKSPKP